MQSANVNNLKLAETIGKSGEGHEGRCPPAQNFFIFMQFSGKIDQIMDWSPSVKSWIRHWKRKRKRPV